MNGQEAIYLCTRATTGSDLMGLSTTTKAHLELSPFLLATGQHNIGGTRRSSELVETARCGMRQNQECATAEEKKNL